MRHLLTLATLAVLATACGKDDEPPVATGPDYAAIVRNLDSAAVISKTSLGARTSYTIRFYGSAAPAMRALSASPSMPLYDQRAQYVSETAGHLLEFTSDSANAKNFTLSVEFYKKYESNPDPVWSEPIAAKQFLIR